MDNTTKICTKCHGTGKQIVLKNPRYNKVSQEQREEMYELYEKGLSLREIARKIGFAENKVATIKHNIEKQINLLNSEK